MLITSMSTSTGGCRDTRHKSEGSCILHLPRGGARNAFRSKVIDASQGGRALLGEKKEEPNRAIESRGRMS